MTTNARWILFFLGGLYAVRLMLIATIQLAPDEAFYWYWAKHPDLSYYDHPPMVAYLMALFTGLGGNAPFFVRLGGLLCTILTHVFVFLTIQRLAPEDRDLPWSVLLLLNATLLLPTGCIVQTPDTPLILFWSIALFCGAALVSGGGVGWWYLSGVALGLGLLSKYTMILIVPCQLAFLLLSANQRHWLLRKEPYLALGIGLLIFSPVIYWNWQHDWMSFGFQLNHGLGAKSDPMISKLGEYVGGQLGVVTPLLFIAFVIYSVGGMSKRWNGGKNTVLYLACLSWPVVIFFTLTTLKGDTAEANWPAMAYIAGMMLTGLVFRQHYRQRKGHRRFMRASVGLGLVMNLVVHLHLAWPFLPIEPNKDPTRQFHGWKAMGERVEELIAQHPSENGYFIVANMPTTVAEMVYYTGDTYTGIHLFELEKYTFLGDLDQLTGKDALILIHLSPDRLRSYEPYFEEVSVIGSCDYIYRDTVINKLSATIALGKGFRGTVPGRMVTGAKEPIGGSGHAN